jgi:chemotaxis protein MotB
MIGPAVAIVGILTGCVSTDTYTHAIEELDAARKAHKEAAAALQSAKQQNVRLSTELSDAQSNLARSLEALAQVERQAEALRQERSSLQSRTDDLQRQVESAQQEVAFRKKALEEAEAQLTHDSAHKEMLAAQVSELKGQLATSQGHLASLASDLDAHQQGVARITQERDRLLQDQDHLQRALSQEQDRLKSEEAEKERLKQEHAAKEDEIRRLTRTQEELAKSLQDEIAKGNIKIRQVRDRLTINMVDRVLFDSGQADVKASGLKVLKQVSGVLKKVTDKQIRIEGHTDNVPVGQKIRGRFPSNWELSTARATSVVRYLIDNGGLNASNLSAIGYADNRPVASNETDEGKMANRRIEITLYPKDLAQIASQIAP